MIYRFFRYILEKDFEEILYSIGLNISRAQVQKLLKRYLSRDRISYRYLTDSWANKDGTVTYRPGIISDPPTTEQLAKGSCLQLFHIFVFSFFCIHI